MKYTPNKIKIDFASYRHYIRGPKKIGKTTLFRDIVYEAYGGYEYGLLIACGNESGFKALDSIYATEALTWSDFKNIITDLVDEKEDNKFKVIGLDTVDELVSIASDEVLRLHFVRKGEKAESLNAAFGGYGAAHRMVADMINDQIKRLENAGYGLVFIGHTKFKTVKDPDGQEYEQITGNLESRFDGIFSDKADIICTACLKKIIKDGKLENTERYLYFRGTSGVDAGSRFVNMPESVPMSAKNYLSAIEKGVKSSFVKDVDPDELTKMKEEEIANKEQRATKFIEEEKKAKEAKTPEQLRKDISEATDTMSKEDRKAKTKLLKEAGVFVDVDEVEDVEILKKVLEILKG